MRQSAIWWWRSDAAAAAEAFAVAVFARERIAAARLVPVIVTTSRQSREGSGPDREQEAERTPG